MSAMSFKITLPLIIAGCVLTSASLLGAAERSLSFNRDVRPILADNCFSCHGPDSGARKAKLRLDQREAALAGGKSGEPTIVPGVPNKSELVRRIFTADEEDAMPPVKAGKKLSSAQKATLRRWIAEGARWEGHWAFQKPTLPVVPRTSDNEVRNPIDAFIRARLQEAGLKPSAEADRSTLIRRLSLDLLGLPPLLKETEAFVSDKRPDAYERLVDHLLASPHFGERWGRHWLDLARYADSDGYEKDGARPTAWMYRDWVINAINHDQPFDQFTIEQLAGDLLPHATDPQRIATGFHRQTLINREGGVDQEEFRCKATVDRAHTTAAVWLGLTLGCAECHTHKFDPITQREFYQFYAFFNNASDRDLPLPTAAERAAYDAATAKWEKKLKDLTSKIEAFSAERLKSLPSKEESRENAERDDTSATKKTTDTLAKLKADLEKHRKAKPELKSAAALVLGAEPRETFIHVRGDFLNKGDRVQPGTLAALHPFEPRGTNADRLDLARWLVSPENPLTARVTVTQVWRQLFGRGLVATENDFGTRGDAPSHPDLLDWLAVKFTSANEQTGGLGWSRKALIRLIVTSAIYRQSSAWRQDVAESDPLNTLLARQGRYRVDAEVVRDIALATSGLLKARVGGPSFKPPLPADLAKLSYADGLKWDATKGDERLRRGLYIHFQRTVPYPMLMAFDAPESNTTCTRRERSNSPLQALTLLNNESFVECAEAFGRRIAASSTEPVARLRFGFQLATGRPPNRQELARLRRFWTGYEKFFQSDDAAVCTAYARVLLNLDETITRE
jgi:Protein of unknown function (DUF1549)/Protein of unknown function (DUF1553)/Planctomycete cytochrome C